MYQVLQECCHSSVNSYLLTVTNANGNEVAVSPCVECDNSVSLLVENLDLSLFYNFTIKSSNNIGEQSTTAVSFCKQYISTPHCLENYIHFKLLCHCI